MAAPDPSNAAQIAAQIAALTGNETAIIIDLLTARRDVLDLQEGLDTLFSLVSGYLVFLMQAGFAMLTAGSVRSKNTKNVLLKNVLDACVGALAFWLFGFAFASGNTSRAPAFIGSGPFALSGIDWVRPEGHLRLHDFFFQWAFAATAATIVSGSVAERTSFYAYMAYAFFLSAFVYPTVAHWVWAEEGWLRTLYASEGGVVDFGGCLVVHMVGGFAGLCGATIVGPRLGRFDSEGKVVPIPGHSATLATLGTFLLWLGWYGFNPGSALHISNGSWRVAERSAVTTTLAAATGGVVTLIALKMRDHIFDLLACLNGILAGLVAITASCALVEPYAAVIIGGVGALVYILAAMVLLRLKIDDPLEAFPIHGAGGMWGAVAVGLFSRQEYQEIAGFRAIHFGAFYGGGGKLLAANVLAILVVMMWTVALIAPLFIGLNVFNLLRISPEEEIIGNDVSKHGGVAYPIDASVAAEKAGTTLGHLGMEMDFGFTEEIPMSRPV